MTRPELEWALLALVERTFKVCQEALDGVRRRRRSSTAHPRRRRDAHADGGPEGRAVLRPGADGADEPGRGRRARRRHPGRAARVPAGSARRCPLAPPRIHESSVVMEPCPRRPLSDGARAPRCRWWLLRRRRCCPRRAGPLHLPCRPLLRPRRWPAGPPRPPPGGLPAAGRPQAATQVPAGVVRASRSCSTCPGLAAAPPGGDLPLARCPDAQRRCRAPGRLPLFPRAAAGADRVRRSTAPLAPPRPRPPPLLIDVTPLSLGVETVGGFCDILIDGTPRSPATTRTFATATEGQTLVHRPGIARREPPLRARTRAWASSSSGIRAAREGERDRRHVRD